MSGTHAILGRTCIPSNRKELNGQPKKISDRTKFFKINLRLKTKDDFPTKRSELSLLLMMSKTSWWKAKRYGIAFVSPNSSNTYYNYHQYWAASLSRSKLARGRHGTYTFTWLMSQPETATTYYCIVTGIININIIVSLNYWRWVYGVQIPFFLLIKTNQIYKLLKLHKIFNHLCRRMPVLLLLVSNCHMIHSISSHKHIHLSPSCMPKHMGIFPIPYSLCMLLQHTCCIIPQNWINNFSLVFCQKKKLTELTWSTTGWSGRKGSVTPTTILWEQVDDKEEEKKTERTVTMIFIKETTSSPLISPEI